MTANERARRVAAAWLAVGVVILAALILATLVAPSDRPTATLDGYLLPWQAPPFGSDGDGNPLLSVALQGASIVTLPALMSGFVVMILAIVAGLSRCAALGWTDTVLQGFTELVGALPRLVVVLVVALLIPREYVSLLPIALTWAILAAPGAMDEAAATAERLGGARFVEALRAHGFSATRIYVYHVTWLNLRGVIMRQAAEVAMQVVFLEIALSYLAASRHDPYLTHGEMVSSWASLLYMGYTWLVFDIQLWHAMALGLALVALVAFMATSFRMAARSR
jgi:peptide/nickel transport system permease protein